jgi:hypothetical protein
VAPRTEAAVEGVAEELVHLAAHPLEVGEGVTISGHRARVAPGGRRYAPTMTGLEQRAADADRERVAVRLRDAAAEGRLDPDELDERLTAAYGARTLGDLVPLTSDLPPEPPESPEAVGALRTPAVRRTLATFLTANIVCIAVWLATGADGSFWPGWVLLGTGIALVSTVIKTALGVDDEDEREEPARRRERGRLPGP